MAEGSGIDLGGQLRGAPDHQRGQDDLRVGRASPTVGIKFVPRVGLRRTRSQSAAADGTQ